MFDVVVIGSGLGGLSAAACLAAAGRSVLVLEQHEMLGGCSQVFRRKKQWEFGVGVHYVGGCVPGSDGLISTVLRGLGVEDRIHWSRMDDAGMDTVRSPEHEFRVPTSWDGLTETPASARPARPVCSASTRRPSATACAMPSPRSDTESSAADTPVHHRVIDAREVPA